MLRKPKENIFTQVGRQVHAIIAYSGLFLTFQRHMTRPIVQFQPVFKRFQASGALAIERDRQAADHEDAVLYLLRLQFVMQRFCGPDEFIHPVQIQLAGWKFSFQLSGQRR